MPGRRLKRKPLRTPEAQTLERLSAALPVKNGLEGRPAPSRSTRITLPAREARSCTLRASSSTKLKLEASPTVAKRLPSEANFTFPTECEGLSEGMQSAPAGKSLQDAPTVLPRITVSLAGDAVSPIAVTRVSRAVFVPS